MNMRILIVVMLVSYFANPIKADNCDGATAKSRDDLIRCLTMNPWISSADLGTSKKKLERQIYKFYQDTLPNNRYIRSVEIFDIEDEEKTSEGWDITERNGRFRLRVGLLVSALVLEDCQIRLEFDSGCLLPDEGFGVLLKYTLDGISQN